MSFFAGKTFKLGPINLTLSNKGIGISIGYGGFRVGKTSGGNTYVSARKGGFFFNKYMNRDTKKQESEKN